MIVYQKRSIYNDGDELPAAHHHNGKCNDDDYGEGDDGDEDENDGH